MLSFSGPQWPKHRHPHALRIAVLCSICKRAQLAISQRILLAQKAQEQAEATELKEALEAATMELKRKAGPNGHLFGGVNAKAIMEEVESQFPGHDAFWKRKSVKITGLTDGNGKKIRSDIKETGEFGAQIALTKNIKSKIKIVVVAED